jgi:hypothetical protein
MTAQNFFPLDATVDGTPRVAVHFFGLLKPEEKELPVSTGFTLAIRRAKALGGRAYRGADLGGCVAIPGYLQQVEEKVSNLLKEAKTYEID